MTETVKGRVQATSDKEDKDFFGICIDDTWYNGDGSLNQDVKGYKLELEIDPDAEFKDIRKINVLEEDNEDGAQSRDSSDAGNPREGSSNSGRKSSSQPHPKRANIQATAATKKAADHVIENKDVEDNGEFVEEVSTLANGLNEIMDKLYEENMQ